MNKKVWLAGEIYDLAVMSTFMIASDIEKRINKAADRDIVKVMLKYEGGVLTLKMMRSYSDYPYNSSFREEMIYCLDEDLLEGSVINRALVPHHSQRVGYGYLYFYPKKEFYKLYRENCKDKGVRKPVNLEFTATNTEMTLTFKLGKQNTPSTKP